MPGNVSTAVGSSGSAVHWDEVDLLPGFFIRFCFNSFTSNCGICYADCRALCPGPSSQEDRTLAAKKNASRILRAFGLQRSSGWTLSLRLFQILEGTTIKLRRLIIGLPCDVCSARHVLGKRRQHVVKAIHGLTLFGVFFACFLFFVCTVLVQVTGLPF